MLINTTAERQQVAKFMTNINLQLLTVPLILVHA
ncbi:UNVERIFIED_CONTAM: hypothetical protein GTU68_040805 [Idotea baltica]|nr:hypothetical protein [Idotea baltica]